MTGRYTGVAGLCFGSRLARGESAGQRRGVALLPGNVGQSASSSGRMAQRTPNTQLTDPPSTHPSQRQARPRGHRNLWHSKQLRMRSYFRRNAKPDPEGIETSEHAGDPRRCTCRRNAKPDPEGIETTRPRGTRPEVKSQRQARPRGHRNGLRRLECEVHVIRRNTKPDPEGIETRPIRRPATVA